MGAIVTIMAGSGLKEGFNSIYALNSIDKMISGHARTKDMHTSMHEQSALILLAHCVLAQFIMKMVSFSDEEKAVVKRMLKSNEILLFSKLVKVKVVEVFNTKFKEAVKKLERRAPTVKMWVRTCT